MLQIWNNLSVFQQVTRFQNISMLPSHRGGMLTPANLPTLSTRSKHTFYAQKPIIKGYTDNDSTYREHSGKSSITRLETTALMITPRMGLGQVCLWPLSMGKFWGFACLFCLRQSPFVSLTGLNLARRPGWPWPHQDTPASVSLPSYEIRVWNFVGSNGCTDQHMH